MSFQFSIVGTGDSQNVTVFVQGQAPLVAHSSHPNFEQIKEAIFSDTTDAEVVERLVDLFDISVAAAKKFDSLSERVTTANGHVFFDGVHVNNALSQQIARFIKEGVPTEQYMSLVNFMENVQQNRPETFCSSR